MKFTLACASSMLKQSLLLLVLLTKSTNARDNPLSDLEMALGSRGIVAAVAGTEEQYIQVQIHEDTDSALHLFATLPDQTRSKVKRLLIRQPCRDSRSLSLIGKFSNLTSLDVCEQGWSPTLSMVVPELSSLTELWVEGAGIDGQDLRSIAKATRLKVLMIGRDQFKGADLDCLRTLTQLTQLSISRCRVQSKHLEFLDSLDKLQCLQLVDTDVDDGLIPIVLKCKRLSILALSGTRLSDDGAARIAREMPAVIVSTGLRKAEP